MVAHRVFLLDQRHQFVPILTQVAVHPSVQFGLRLIREDRRVERRHQSLNVSARQSCQFTCGIRPPRPFLVRRPGERADCSLFLRIVIGARVDAPENRADVLRERPILGAECSHNLRRFGGRLGALGFGGLRRGFGCGHFTILEWRRRLRGAEDRGRAAAGVGRRFATRPVP